MKKFFSVFIWILKINSPSWIHMEQWNLFETTGGAACIKTLQLFENSYFEASWKFTCLLSILTACECISSRGKTWRTTIHQCFLKITRWSMMKRKLFQQLNACEKIKFSSWRFPKVMSRLFCCRLDSAHTCRKSFGAKQNSQAQETKLFNWICHFEWC